MGLDQSCSVSCSAEDVEELKTWPMGCLWTVIGGEIRCPTECRCRACNVHREVLTSG